VQRLVRHERAIDVESLHMHMLHMLTCTRTRTCCTC
jgi:hypothetical protein